MPLHLGGAPKPERQRMIIAIDGPAASGKGTLAKRIAAHFCLPVLDTGLLYRAVARDLMAAGHELDDPHAGARIAKALDPASLMMTLCAAQRPAMLHPLRRKFPT